MIYAPPGLLCEANNDWKRSSDNGLGGALGLGKDGKIRQPREPRSSRAALLQRLARLGYRTKPAPFDVGPLHFDFIRIADPDEVLDRVAAEEDRREKLSGQRKPGDQLHLPYWAELWDSGLAVAEHLVERRERLTVQSVLDL